MSVDPAAPRGSSSFGSEFWRAPSSVDCDLPELTPSSISEDQFRLLADNIPTLCWMANGDGYIVWYNRRWHEYCGTSPEEMEGWGWQSVHDPALLPQVMERWTTSVATGEPFEMTFPLRGADGTFRPFLTRVQPLRDATGRVVRWFGVNTEISEQITAEAELAKREAHLAAATAKAEASAAEREAILGQLAEGVIVTDAAGRITFVNQAAADIHGVAAIGTTPDRYTETYRLFTVDGEPYPTEDLPLVRALRDGRSCDNERWIIRRADGVEVLAIGSARPFLDPQGNHVGGILTLRDDTARIVTEQNLQESEYRFRTLVEVSPQVVWFGDAKGRLTYCNPVWYEYTGLSEAQTVGLGWLDVVHPDRREGSTKVWEQAARSSEPFEHETLFRGRDGNYRWFLSKGVPIRGADGKVERWIGIALDIHERRLSEERQRLLMAEVDHRAKNMLAVLQSMIRLTSKPSAAEYQEAIEGRIAALARAQTLLSQTSWKGADFRRLIEEELEPFLADGATGAVLSGPTATIVPEGAQAVALVIHELAVNAMKYGALSVAQGKLSVTWSVLQSGDLSLVWQERGGPTVQEPDRRGFGSTVIETSVRHQLGGSLAMDWVPEGLTCRFTIRADSLAGTIEPRDPAMVRPTADPVELRGTRVLVVEDNALVALEVVDALQREGCVVVGPAATTDHAASLLERVTFDTAVLDVSLKDGDSLGLARCLRERAIPFVFATGYGQESNLLNDFSDVAIIRKPFTGVTLTTELKRAIGTGRAELKPA